MESIADKLNLLKNEVSKRKIKIMIMGLGSVGHYLLDYLMSMGDEGIEIFVVGRNYDKMLSDVNIIRVASLIRGENRTNIEIVGGVDFNCVTDIRACLESYAPDIIINSSRAYSGLKYGSISWNNIRAYGIWAPLAIKFIKNIMEAYDMAASRAIVINTSYSDAVIPWLKSKGLSYPDFGSGNLNHLLPRMKFAIAKKLGISDYWNIDLTFATSHFHDVLISKEGQTENVEPLCKVYYQGKEIEIELKEIYAMCRIAMPVDYKRNMMNASSNFEIIRGILDVIRNKNKVKLHSPGVFGEIGGYPVIIDGSGAKIDVYIDEESFRLEEMRNRNKESIYLDGIQDVKDGVLVYTNELIEKVKNVFGVTLEKEVCFENIENVAEFLIKEIIEKNS